MVDEDRRRRTSEQAAQPKLPSGGAQQVLAADDEIDAMAEIVHHDGQLVGPVAQAVPHQQVAALLRGVLALLTEAAIDEALLPGVDPDPDTPARCGREPPVPAVARIARLLVEHVAPVHRDILAGAVAGEDARLSGEARDRGSIDLATVALPPGRAAGTQLVQRSLIGLEAQPGEVVEESGLILGTASTAVMVLEPEQHPTAQHPGHAPDVDGVGHMAQVQVAGRARREPGERGGWQASGKCFKIEWRHPGMVRRVYGHP